MKVKITLKDPDALYEAVRDAVSEEVSKLKGLSDGEKERIADDREQEAREKIASQWMEYGEYLEVEFDLDAATATVIPIKK